MNPRPMLRKSPDSLPQEGQEVLPLTPLLHLEHLLKVARSFTQDANNVWADIWAQFEARLPAGGTVGSELNQGFIPACGWPDFLEKLWLLSYYLDSVQRIFRKEF